MQAKDNSLNANIIAILKQKVVNLLADNPSLQQFQYSIDQILEKSSSEQCRTDILDIVYRSKINELNSKIKYLNELLDSLIEKS